VAAAARTIDSATASNAALAHFNTSRLRCVRAQRITFHEPSTDSIVSDYWTVGFYSDDQPDIDERVGEATGAMTLTIARNEFGYAARQMCASA
jgi:hypothetical protein